MPLVDSYLREDEVWYVIDGDFRFKAGDEMFHVSTAAWHSVPGGVPHAFQNIGIELGRLLVITTPSGLERFFEQTDKLPALLTSARRAPEKAAVVTTSPRSSVG